MLEWADQVVALAKPAELGTATVELADASGPASDAAALLEKDAGFLALRAVLESRVSAADVLASNAVQGIIDLVPASAASPIPTQSMAADAISVLAGLPGDSQEPACVAAIEKGAIPHLLSLMSPLRHPALPTHFADRIGSPPHRAIPDDRPDEVGPPPSLTPADWQNVEAATRAVSVLAVNSPVACQVLVEGSGLALLASATSLCNLKAAVPAAAGIAAIGLWSGPQRAVAIVDTPNVVAAMARILKDGQHASRSPAALRSATADALAALATRHRARAVIRAAGCADYLGDMAKSAQLSGDMDIAAKASVAAGQVAGMREDENGFMVDQLQDSPSCGNVSADVPLDDRLQSLVAQATANSRMDRRQSVVPDIRKGQKGLASPLVPTTRTSSSLVAFASASQTATQNLREKTSQEQQEPPLADQAEMNRWEAIAIKAGSNFPRDSRGKVKGYKSMLGSTGIHPTFRHKIWPKLLNVEIVRKQNTGLFQRALEVELDHEVDHTIEVDVVRTMPQHRLFWVGGAQVGVESLRRILHAYAVHVPEVGYCQGMSSLAAMLLMNSNSEEEAFFMMKCFMDQFDYVEVYRHGFPGLWKWMEQFNVLGKRFVPEVMAHLDRHGIDSGLYVDKWFITSLTYNFPHGLLLRLWDILLCEGNNKIIFRAALAVLKLGTPTILAMSFDDLLPLLQKDFGDPKFNVTNDANRFIATCYSFAYKRKEFEPSLPSHKVGCFSCSAPGSGIVE